MTERLSPEDAAAVLRRAAELDTTPLDEQDVLDEDVVRAAAAEVGLSRTAVDRAVQEWRAGALQPLPDLPPDRRLGLAAATSVERVLRLPGGNGTEAVEQWLQAQWFERRRVRGQESEWAPRAGVLASARRAADVQGRLRLRGVRRVRLCVAPAPGGTRVRLVADLGDHRSGLVSGFVTVPAVAVGVAVGLVTGLPGDALPEVLLAGPAAVAGGATGWLGARRAMERKRTQVAEVLEGALDEVEAPTPRPSRALPGWVPRLQGR